MEFLTISWNTTCHAFIHAGFHMECLIPILWQIHSIIQQIFTVCAMCRHCIRCWESKKNQTESLPVWLVWEMGEWPVQRSGMRTVIALCIAVSGLWTSLGCGRRGKGQSLRWSHAWAASWWVSTSSLGKPRRRWHSRKCSIITKSSSIWL